MICISLVEGMDLTITKTIQYPILLTIITNHRNIQVRNYLYVTLKIKKLVIDHHQNNNITFHSKIKYNKYSFNQNSV